MYIFFSKRYMMYIFITINVTHDAARHRPPLTMILHYNAIKFLYKFNCQYLFTPLILLCPKNTLGSVPNGLMESSNKIKLG